MQEYLKAALTQAQVKYLGKGEGYCAKIPGFDGLIVFAENKTKLMEDLEWALQDWINLSLKMGHGLPNLCVASAGELISH